MKRFFAVAGLGLALSCSAIAQTPAPQAPARPAAAMAASATPTVDQILDHYLQASGGRDAWMKVTTRISKGTIDIPGMNVSGTIEIHEKAPNHVIAVVSIGGAAFKQGFDGKVGWSDDPQNGLREQGSEETAETRRDSDFYRPLDMRDLYKKLVVVGAEKVGDRDAYVVEATTAEGADPDKLYFDAQTGFPIRVVTKRHTPDGVTPIQEDFSDYREVDGVKFPYVVHQSNSATEFTITITEVHQNVDLDEAQFSKPAAQ
jgi:zinc protease